MATITTRAGKGSPLTNTEVDDNFSNLNSGKAELAGAAFTGAITTNSTFDGRDVGTDGTKLDTVETNADVTDTTNVTAAGALMDSEVTNLAQVKAFDSSDYASAAQGTTANAALPKAGGAMTGAITTNSTFDGRDVATDGTKLDGIEPLADVTDATNVTAAGALMDSELTAIASVKALNQGVATTDDPTFTNTQLAAIAESKSDTATDVFVYDTSKDSDGGAWRHRTQHTSWYNETLNTSTRGATKKFPAVAVIVAESNKVTIYDGDDPTMPMWMVFNNGVVAWPLSTGMLPEIMTPVSLTMMNGLLGLCAGSSNYGFIVIEFIKDAAELYSSSDDRTFRGNISQRHLGQGWPTNNSPLIASYAVHDVAMTVLPNAPIDADTGLPVPTIAVATDGGVSVIKDDGSVVDITSTSHSNANQINFTKENQLSFYNAPHYSLAIQDIPTSDETGLGSMYSNSEIRYSSYDVVGSPNLVGDSGAGSASCHTHTPDYQVVTGSPSGMTSIQRVPNAPHTGLSNYITSDYNTGWMNGGIRLATLSDTDTADVTGSELLDQDFSNWLLTGTVIDTSVYYSSPNSIKCVSNSQTAQSPTFSTVAGKRYTLTFKYKDPSGAANHHAEFYLFDGNATSVISHTWPPAYTSEWQTFTLTFTSNVTGSNGYLKLFPDDSETIFFDDISIREAEEDRSVNGNGLQVFGTVTKDPVATGADLVGYSGFSASNYLEQPYNSDLDFGTGDFCYMGWVKRSASLVSVFFHRGTTVNNSETVAYADSNGNLVIRLRSNNDQLSINGIIPASQWTHVAVLRQGGVLKAYVNGKLVGSRAETSSVNYTTPLNFGIWPTNNFYFGSTLALWRISATAPTPEQIAKIYNDEKHLFQANAKATLYGTSDAVTALAYDDGTELLHAGTSAGRSVFQGLRRVDNTTDAVGSAISASNGLVAED